MITSKLHIVLPLAAGLGLSIAGVAGPTSGTAEETAEATTGEHARPAAEGSQVRLVTAEDLGIPRPGMAIDPSRTAIVITDPQNDFLSPDGVTWGVVGDSVTENGTVEHIETLFKVGGELGVPVFISPHYYYPHDHEWQFGGALEVLMHSINMFDREDPLSVEGLDGSGADWLEQYVPYIRADNVVVAGPHKVYGPDTNDLVLQLRKRGIDKVILAGMSANLCTESHMRELLEQGFEVTVVKDATAGARTPAGDGYEAALANFHYMASAVVTTDEAAAGLRKAFGGKQEM
jgi:nicotinamidase-related amidase